MPQGTGILKRKQQNGKLSNIRLRESQVQNYDSEINKNTKDNGKCGMLKSKVMKKNAKSGNCRKQEYQKENWN
jgi:hypothetical protein